MEDLESGWKTGPSLPDVAHIATMMEFDGEVVLVGGQGGVGCGVDGRPLYQLTGPDDTWTKLEQTLKEGRFGHVSFLIPDELTNCH